MSDNNFTNMNTPLDAEYYYLLAGFFFYLLRLWNHIRR